MTTTPPDIIRLATEVGVLEHGPLTRNWSFELSQLERFTDLVISDFLQRTGQYVTSDAAQEAAIAQAVATERSARQTAQSENADLKARLARSGVEMRKAVREMREACAEEADSYASESRTALLISQAIRATPMP